MRRHASRRVKHPEKMATAVSDLGREFVKGEVRFEPALNELLNPKQVLLREHRGTGLSRRLTFTEKQKSNR